MTVDPKITDAVTQTNVKVVGESPAMAMASLYVTMANSVAMASMNAVYAQQQANMVHQASTARSVARTASTRRSTFSSPVDTGSPASGNMADAYSSSE